MREAIGIQFQKKIRRESDGVLDLIRIIEAPELSVRRISVQRRSQMVCLEAAIWKDFEAIARKELLTLEELCNEVAAETPRGVPFGNAIRSYVLNYYRQAAALSPAPPRLLF